MDVKVSRDCQNISQPDQPVVSNVMTKVKKILRDGVEFFATFIITASLMLLILGLSARFAKADDTPKVNLLNKLSLDYKVRARMPSHFVPNDEIIAAPDSTVHWTQELLIDDRRGNLAQMREALADWERKEEYARNWNLESTGLIETVDIEHKKKFVKKRALKYLDKRITGEVKRAKEGSTLHRIGQVQTALKPSTKINVTPNLRMRFKARVLEGKAIIKAESPYVKAETHANAFNGDLDLNVFRKFETAQLETRIHYNIKESEWTAQATKKLNSDWSTTLKSKQEGSAMAFSDDADKIIQFDFYRPF